DAHDRVVALLGELLTATLSDDDIDAGCRELHARHDEFQQYYREDGERNWSLAERPEFIWGAIVDGPELPTWLALVERHFPTSSELAEKTRQRLLSAGAAWLGARNATPGVGAYGGDATQTEFDVVLAHAGENKILVIKAI